LIGGKFLSGCGVPAGSYIGLPTDQVYTEAATVASVRGLDLYEMTRQVVRTVGGMESVVQPGETVFIKPNFGGLGFSKKNVFTTGECTKVEIVTVVAEECLKAGASSVTIGEAGQVRSFSWDLATTLDGTTTLVREAGRLSDTYGRPVRLACLSADSPSWDGVPSPHTNLGEIKVSSLATRADRVISIGVLKSHRWTQVTGALKNFVGVTSTDHYGLGSPDRLVLHGAAGGIEQCFLDIAATLRPDLSIVDGSIGCEGNGPHVMPGWWGTTVDVKDRLGDWFLLASRDPAAVDATAARIIGIDADRADFLARANAQGLGQIRQDSIQVVGPSIQDLRVEWKLAEPTVGFGDVLIPGIHLLLGG
jgi:uncharacterized protein (DUF362 family)